MTGLPAGAAAKATVSGPAGASELDTSSPSTLAGGRYTVSGNPVAVSNPLVRTAYRAAPVSVCVRSGQSTTAALEFTAIPSSGKVWTGNGPGGAAPMLGFAAPGLAASGSPAADVAAQTQGAGGFTFDREGNLWVVGGTTADPPVLRYSASSLGGSGKKTADLQLSGGPLEGGFPRAVALAFDPEGALWVSVGFNDKVLKYAAGQLSGSGSPTPAVELTSLEGPGALAFDQAGNLWVAFSGASRVGRYNASRLSSSSTASPDLVIEAKTPPPVTGTLSSPQGLAFDAAGNLWVNYNGTLARLTPADQGSTGSQVLTPAVQIRLSVSALPEGMAFDESGGMWFAHSAGKFGRLPSTALTSSGTKAPDVIISSPDVGYANSFALYPAPAGVPLFHRLP